MDDKILEFAGLLRQNGLRVSMAEHMDTFHALTLVGVHDRTTFKDTLRATMVKRGVDMPAYDELFDLYFTGLGEIIRGATEATQGAMSLTDAQLQALMEQLSQMLQDMGIELSEQQCRPVCDPVSLESNVRGVYVAGVIVAGSRTNEIFIENGRFHGKQIAEDLKRRLRD